MRAYFENNYRTSRKVVEDLLIEEIIQKAYSLRTGKEKDTEELAQTLLEIRDQMVELSQKKQQIACYDRQIGAISEFIQRFEPLMQIFEQRDINEEKTSVLYHELLKEQERLETLAQELEEKLKLSEEQKKETERQLQTLELQELEYAFDDVRYDREKKEKEAKLLEESQTLLHDAIISKESVNYFLQYKKAQSKEKTIEAEIESLKKGNEELLSAIVQMTAQKKRKDEDGKECLSSQKEAAQEQLSEYRREWQTAQAEERKADISLGGSEGSINGT